MPKPKPSADEEQFLHDVTRQYLRGVEQAEIARRLKCTPARLRSALRKIQKGWQTLPAVRLTARQAAELAKLDELERTYWEAWEQSQYPREISTTERTDEEKNKAKTTRTKASLRKESRAGVAEYLKGVERCIARRVHILALNPEPGPADDKAAGTTRNVKAAENATDEDTSHLTLEQRLARAFALLDFIALHAARTPGESADEPLHGPAADAGPDAVPPA